MKDNLLRCKLNDCLCYGKNKRTGICEDPVPSALAILKPNNKTCPFYSNDFDADLIWLKTKGGIMNLVTTNNKDRKKRLKGVENGEEEEKPKVKKQKQKKKKK